MQLNHLTQRRNAIVLSVERHKTGMTPIADVDGIDRGGAVGNCLPDANACQLLAGPRRERNRPGIKPG